MGASKNIWAILEAEDEASGNNVSPIPYSSMVVDTSLPLPLMVPLIMFVFSFEIQVSFSFIIELRCGGRFLALFFPIRLEYGCKALS